MLLSSPVFLFAFLPVTLLVYFLLGRKNHYLAAGSLLAASLFSYLCWDYRFLAIFLASICLNYVLYLRICAASHPRKKLWLAGAVLLNLGLLGYFKYANFFLESLSGLTGTAISPLSILLPVGISFFTFTQLSLQVDAYHGRTGTISLNRYMLFVAYFPYIVAGPVLHHQDILPQFDDSATYRPQLSNFAIGLTLLVFGLAKKLLIADQIAPIADAAYSTANPSLLIAWLGVFAYTLQLYFDFSGYSDMAIGVSRLFGVQIPFNFNSPYKSTSVSEFWLRWHISLSRFLKNYLYIALGGNRHGQLARYRNLLLTMLLGGLWHGANWTFVVWGGLHGLYLCIQHGWRQWHGTAAAPSSGQLLINRLLTFLAVMIAWNFFRAPDLHAALAVLFGMIGGNGASLMTDVTGWQAIMLAVATGIAFLLPNTNQLFVYLDSHFANQPDSASLFETRWHPSLGWAVATGLLLAICLLSMDKTQDFIYAQF